MPEQTHEKPKEMKGEVMKLAVIIAIVIVVGGFIYNSESKKENNSSNNQNNQTNQTNQGNMDKKITAETAYTITDPNLQIKPPTDEEVKNFDAEAENKIAVIDTNKGLIKVKLYPKDAPFTVASFMKLIDKGLYNGLIFHRVIDKFMIQGGDPSGNGTGGPGYKFVDELNPETPSYKKGYKKGVLAMANSGPNTNGSQFFIMVADYPLQNNYTIFGEVVSGQNVADAISKVQTSQNPTTKDRPLQDVKINKIYLEDAK